MRGVNLTESLARERERRRPHVETVKLTDCKPFPLRDYTVDPIREEHVKILCESIREYGFWGGIALRRNAKAELEIIDGAHRILAAMAEGIIEANLYVGTLSDEEAIRLYKTHNTPNPRVSENPTLGEIDIKSCSPFL